jgi:hypothetical protein
MVVAGKLKPWLPEGDRSLVIGWYSRRRSHERQRQPSSANAKRYDQQDHRAWPNRRLDRPTAAKRPSKPKLNKQNCLKVVDSFRGASA